MNRPLILISNDDGYQALGVRTLAEWLKPFADVVVVCPDGPRSGQSMAITVNAGLRITELPSDPDGTRWYKVNGTPVDCVKLAMYTVCKDRRPDLVVAGINHGSNSAVNVVYSGTMGAVFEGCAFGIPSIGFSLTDHAHDADFSPAKPYVEKITAEVLENGLPHDVCLNVNVPDIKGPAKGMKVVRACRGHWSDEYEEYTDPSGHKFYMLKGKFINEEPESEDTDEWCLSHGYVSVVPVMLDRTAPMP
ncbi:MAG: 5'/3'-nucleotidase SurE [Muribaculum sp.]|nr:5'/3'-nucleotidase SurE [Muribaculum sp.]